MATYDFRSTKVGEKKIGILLEWESQRIVASTSINPKNQDRTLTIKTAKAEDVEALQLFLKSAPGAFSVQNKDKFIQLFAAVIPASYVVKGGKTNEAKFDSAKKAQAFAEKNNAQLAQIFITNEG